MGHILVYDLTLGKPGCVLLQAAFGDNHSLFDFDPSTWLTHPTENMRAYHLNERQYQTAIDITKYVAAGYTVNQAINLARKGKDNAED